MTAIYRLSLLGLCIAALLLCASCGAKQPAEQSIVQREEVLSIYYEINDGTVSGEITDGRSTAIVDSLNTAVYDNAFNDGRSVKITAPAAILRITYADGSELTTELWEDRIRIDRIWYLLDTKDIIHKLTQ